VRVDLVEVEGVLCQHHAVRAVALRAWPQPSGDVVLAAYMVLNPEMSSVVTRDAEQAGLSSGQAAALAGWHYEGSSTGLPADMARWCAERLPAAARPNAFLLLPQLPRTAGGKLARSQLPAPPGLEGDAPRAHPAPPGLEGEGAHAHPAPPGSAVAGHGGYPASLAFTPGPPAKRSRVETPPPLPSAAAAWPPSEGEVGRLFAAALGHANFEATSNLFALGGSSLTATMIAGWLGIAPETVFEHPSIRLLTRQLAATATAIAHPAFDDQQQQQQQQQQQEQQQHSMADDSVRLASEGGAWTVRRVQGGAAAAPTAAAPRGKGLPLRQPRLAGLWTHKMGQCVDAPPLISHVGSEGGGPAEVVVACSHGGDVACLPISMGVGGHAKQPPAAGCPSPLWAHLPLGAHAGVPADAGMAVCGDRSGRALLCLALNNGSLVFRQLASGRVFLIVCLLWSELEPPPWHSCPSVKSSPAELMHAFALPCMQASH
jgi:hypothetical protein